MTPYEFLQEELNNVERALSETLRHDYGPERGDDYFKECNSRLDQIRASAQGIVTSDSAKIAALLNELSLLASWVFLIERSHLGEFSWPFSEELCRLAQVLLARQHLSGGEILPIVHIVAEAEGYQINFETRIPTASVERPFVIVAFPRSLKHHVLLHAIFGHELGHTALETAGIRSAFHKEVLQPLIEKGALSSEGLATDWLNVANAPTIVSDALDQFESEFGRTYAFIEADINAWVGELACDLFGLILFGPAFMGAHRTILESQAANPYYIDPYDSTHPPYAVRQLMLVKAMRVLGWDQPSIKDKETFAKAEAEFLKYALNNAYDPWADIFSDDQLKKAIDGIERILSSKGLSGYHPIEQSKIFALLQRLQQHVPPIVADISSDGSPQLEKTPIAHILYAGWIYWTGRKNFTQSEQMPFFVINRLCDQALLQQRAINLVLKMGAS
jgi:hypothetical protein